MEEFLLANAEMALFGRNYMDMKSYPPFRFSDMAMLNIIAHAQGTHGREAGG